MAEVISTSDSRWQDVLGRVPHDVYHLPRYCEFAARQERGNGFALYAERRGYECLMPLISRPVPNQFTTRAVSDAMSPYGYASPLFTTSMDPDVAPVLVRELVNEAASRDIVALFLRLHPLLPSGHEGLQAVGDVVQHGQTVYVELTRAESDIEQSLASGHRYEIRRLRKLGYSVRFDEWEELRSFAEMYRGTMARVGAHNSYLFPDSYFRDLRASLPDALHICLAYSPEGELAAGALFTDVPGIMQYHLSATAEQHLRLAPTKLVLREIIRWGQERNRNLLHLGGGVGGAADSLFKFKAGFSPDRAEFRTCRVVSNPERYAELVRSWELASGRAAGADYFPAYRRPIAS